MAQGLYIKMLLFIAALVLGPGLVIAQDQVDSKHQSLCIQNFNIYGPIYAKNIALRTQAVASYFMQPEASCQVIHLQEAWNQGQIDILEYQLGARFQLSMPNKKAKIGLMSAFFGEIHNTTTYSFRLNNEGGLLDSVRQLFNVKKAFHIAEVSLVGLQGQYYLVNTHLHPSSVPVRVTQILDILNWRLGNQNKKMILSGDFNSDIGSMERQLVLLTLGVHDSMENVFGGRYPADYCTYCAENPLGWTTSSYTFDYVFYSNVGDDSTLLVPETGEVNMKGSPRQPWSDHYGLRVYLSLLPSGNYINQNILEERRDRGIKVFEALSELLGAQKNSEFQVYELELRNLAAQLRGRSGPFYDYFIKYR